MSESEIMFHLFYILIFICIIYPPSEFVSAGFTIENIFSKWIGSELIQFVQYQILRTSITAIIHSLLPIGYIIMYEGYFADANTFNTAWKLYIWRTVMILGVMLPIFCFLIIWFWSRNNWENHPLCKSLQKFTNNNASWQSIAQDINLEYRRNDKLKIKTNSITTVIATENWIVKTTLYKVYIAHQSDTALIAFKTDLHLIGQDTSESVQYVNILVKSTRSGVDEFNIRINALDFIDLQDRVARPISILSNVQFHQTVIDRWIQVFKDQISLNPRYTVNADQITDSCFACMVAEPNVKLVKQCADVGGDGEIVPEQNRCGNCYCRPMWCVDCMAKWFASKQNQFEREIWLQQKCTCPMCRASFCILDICYINKVNG